MSRKVSRKAKVLRASPGRQTRVKKNQNQDASAGSIMNIPRQIAFPDAFRTKLRYTIPMTLITGGGVLNSVRMTSNAYDVDPALGSTAMSGFVELATVYSRFRTLRMDYQFNIVNLELFGQALIHGMSTTSISSGSLGENYSENSRFKQTVLSQLNGSRNVVTVRGGAIVKDLFGTNQALFDDTFTGSTTSSTLPSSGTAYAYVGLIATAVQVSGYEVTGTITLDVLFDRKNAIIS